MQGECQIESFAVRRRNVGRPHVPVAPMSLSGNMGKRTKALMATSSDDDDDDVDEDDDDVDDDDDDADGNLLSADYPDSTLLRTSAPAFNPLHRVAVRVDDRSALFC